MLQILRSKSELLAGFSRIPIRRRVLIMVCLLTSVVALAGYFGFHKLHAQISEDANLAAEREMQSVQDLLDLHRQLYLEQVRASMQLLKRETLRLGAPRIDGEIVVDGKKIPNLVFGTTPMSNNTKIIGSVEALMGGKTTILVRQGNSFFRIATNLVDSEGASTLNTEVDPNGPGVKALREGDNYVGIINILGVAYIGEDDAIRDPQGQVIGAWFVGFEIENLGQLVSRISSKHILDNGFVALFDTHHKIVAQSEHIDPALVHQLCDRIDQMPENSLTWRSSKWSIRKETFEPWDYSIITATYIPDVAWRAANGVWLIFSVVGVIAIGALLAQGAALIRARQMKDEAEKARLSAEEASRTKSAFLANMSHELRTPLNAIIGYSEMIIEEVNDRGEEDLEPDLRKIQTSGKHLLSLINDILDLSKIEAGKMTLYFEEFNVPQTVREIASTIEPLLVKNGNTLELDCPDEVGMIYADVTKTRQILFNLLSNASKFTTKGKVGLRCSRDSKFVHFAVQDTGVGIPREVQDKIFREFSQADDSTTRKFGGTGLGLAISKRFCEMMGGSIRLESTTGVGTTFFFDLPLKATGITAGPGVEIERKPQPEKIAPPVAPLETPIRPVVLIVDDDLEIQDLMRRILEKEGYQVAATGNGQEAICLAESLQPCLITLDIMMPGIDGWTVLAALKKNEKTRDIPAVVVSIVDNKSMALALGAVDYLSKPFDRERIMQVLNRYGPTNAPRVLIIEDDINSYEVLVRVLEKDGLKVSYAPNGRIGLEMVNEVKPGLIVVDLNMPELNGFDFLTELRRRANGKTIPVFVLSGRDLTQQEQEWLGQNAQKTILKGSISMHDLASEVRRYLPAAAVAKK